MQEMNARWRVRFFRERSELCLQKNMNFEKNEIFESVNFVKIEILKMWILWKMRFWKCEFCENLDFENVNFVKIGNLEMLILPKWEAMIFEATPSVQNEDKIKKSWTLPISTSWSNSTWFCSKGMDRVSLSKGLEMDSGIDSKGWKLGLEGQGQLDLKLGLPSEK